jgi:hypothetical protein
MMIPIMLALTMTVQVQPEMHAYHSTMMTRGPSDAINTAWQATLIEANRASQTSPATLILQRLQTPVHIDNVIPAWGILTGFGLLVFYVITHEARLNGLEKTIRENHDDLKQYIRDMLNRESSE